VRGKTGGSGGQTLQLPHYGEVGIRDILRSWITEHDKVKTFGSNACDGSCDMDVSPPKRVSQIRLNLMKRAGIDRKRTDADVLLKAHIRTRHRLKDPIHVTISSPTLLAEIRSEDSPLNQLLVFVLDKEASIRPGDNNPVFELDLELLIKEFRRLVTSQ
jgi:hypothetical protein